MKLISQITRLSIRHCSTKVTHFTTKTLLEFLDPPKFLNCNGELTEADRVFRNKKIIAYYFSASWCNPCKQLLPKLKAIYKLNKDMKSGLEVIYISADQEEDKMLEYFKQRHGGWYAIPFGSKAMNMLRQTFDVNNVPQIFVVKLDDGTIISRTGVKDIEKLGADVLVAWNTDEPI